MRSEGADVIELGPAASHPGSARVSAEEEQRRLAPVLGELVAEGIPVSVDSFLPQTQRFAVAHGTSYLNDIQGFPDSGRYPELAHGGYRLIVMHSVQRTGPATKVSTDPDEVWAGLEEFFAGGWRRWPRPALARSGSSSIPGLATSWAVIPNPRWWRWRGSGTSRPGSGCRSWHRPSRKSFLRTLTGRDIAQVGPASLAAELFAVWQGADYVRTHDVAALRDALIVLNAVAEQAGSAHDDHS